MPQCENLPPFPPCSTSYTVPLKSTLPPATSEGNLSTVKKLTTHDERKHTPPYLNPCCPLALPLLPPGLLDPFPLTTADAHFPPTIADALFTLPSTLGP